MRARALGLLLLFAALNAASDTRAEALTAVEIGLLGRLDRASAFEIEASELATKKAVSPEVRALGDRLGRDARWIQHRIASIAGHHAITLEGDRHAEIERSFFAMSMVRLESATAGAFDHAYLAAVREELERTTSELGDERRRVRSADVRGLVQRSLPILRENLELIYRLTKRAWPVG
jgi:predicted outer membrane protein